MTPATTWKTGRPAMHAGAAATVLCCAFALEASVHAAHARTNSLSAPTLRCSAQTGDSGDYPAATFQKHRRALSKPGVHEQDGWWFSAASQVLPPDAPPSLVDSTRRRLAVAALGQLSAVRYGQLLPEGSASPEVRLTASEVARTCDPAPWSAAGVVTVLDESDRGAVTVVRAVPASSLMRSLLSRDDVVSRLRARAHQQALTLDEALVLVELGPPEPKAQAEAAEAALKSIDAAFGRGVSMTVRREWTLPDGRLCTECVQGWMMSAARAVAGKSESSGVDVAAHASEIRKLDRDETLQLLARRMHDKALRSHAASLLAAQGWHRCAELIGGETLEVKSPQLARDSNLPDALRRAVLESPLLITLLLSGGSAPIALSPDEGPEIQEALDCLRLDPKDSECGAARMLVDSLNRNPSTPAAKVLAGLLLNGGEPTVARVLMQAVLRASPNDALAAVYLLRADRALGDRISSQGLAARMLSDMPLTPQWRAETESFISWSRGQPQQ